MAVWLSFPPCSETIATTPEFASSTASDGKSSRATITEPGGKGSLVQGGEPARERVIRRPTSRMSCSRWRKYALSSRCKRSTQSRITESRACSTLTNSRPTCCLTRVAISFAIAEWTDNSAAESTSFGSLKAVCSTSFMSWLDCSSALSSRLHSDATSKCDIARCGNSSLRSIS